MNYRTRLTLAIASAAALLTWTAVIVVTPNATGATITATYPGCDQTMPLNDQWPLKVDGGDIIRPTNRVATLAGWGPANGVTFNGSSARGVGGMLFGPTNINIGARDFVVGATLKTNDTRYNGPIQFGNNPNAGGGGVGPGAPGFVKLTGVYATLVGERDTVKLSDQGIGDDPTQPGRAVPPTGDRYSDNHNTTNQTTYLCVQRIGGVLSYYVNGHLQESSTVDVGPINLTPADNPVQMLGKYQPGIGYDADDMCGVERISSTDHNAFLPTVLNRQEWNVQVSTRVAP